MVNLQQLSKEFNCENATQAIAQIRNAIAHPISKSKQSKIKSVMLPNMKAIFLAWSI